MSADTVTALVNPACYWHWNHYWHRPDSKQRWGLAHRILLHAVFPCPGQYDHLSYLTERGWSNKEE